MRGVTLETRPTTGVRIDHLVDEMLKKGPINVAFPKDLPEHDLQNIREILGEVIARYSPYEQCVPRQRGPRQMGGVTLMALLESRDYQGAFRYLTLEGEFLP